MSKRKRNEIEKIIQKRINTSMNVDTEIKFLRRRLRALVRKAWHDGYAVGDDSMPLSVLTEQQTIEKYGFRP